MTSLLSFRGELGRGPYALAAFALFGSQHLVVVSAFRLQGRTPLFDFWFFLSPLRSLAGIYQGSPPLLAVSFAYFALAAWVLSALSFRRAADARLNGWIAAFVVAPIVQVAAILFLCAVPPRRQAAEAAPDSLVTIVAERDWAAAAQGVVAATVLTLFAVAVGALIFGVYGYGMFLVSPFVVGAMTGYFANRHRDVGKRRTMEVVVLAAVVSGVALMVAAFEGIVCLVMAAPIGIGAAMVGGLLGRAIAGRSGHSAPHTLSVFVLLPLVFTSEWLLPLSTYFETVQTVEIDAPPNIVWQSILHMDMSREPISLPSRLGLAYPLRGEIVGEGVGSLRRGEFSTGTAIERVTEWEAGRKLAFVVEKDVPALRELSFYKHVHAPHVIGYFMTTYTSFELVPLPDGRTQMVERTSHEIRLEPILYWMPLARWVVDQNNARVLDHIRRQAEK